MPSARAAAVHAVERPRHVGPHRLALPVGERARVAAARRLERSALPERRHDLRNRDRCDRDRIAPHRYLAAHRHLHARGGEARHRPETSRRRTGGAPRSPGRSPRPRRALAPGTAPRSGGTGSAGRRSSPARTAARGRPFIDRAADSAARSAARCARPLPASALPSENSTDAPSISTNSAPSATISAWPRSDPVCFAFAALILSAAEATRTGVRRQHVAVTERACECLDCANPRTTGTSSRWSGAADACSAQ